MPVYYAHSNGPDPSKWQKLRAHLQDTAELARNLGEDSGLADFASAAALLHDIGKYHPMFQKRLAGGKVRIDHSTAGAKEIVSRFNDTPVKEIISRLLAYCIAGHHSGLPDYGGVTDTEAEGTLYARLHCKPVNGYEAYAEEIDLKQLSLPASLPIRPTTPDKGFSLSFFTRMIYSLLVDADFIETETFMNAGAKPRGEYAALPALCAQLDHHLSRFDHPTNPIDQKRTETLRACLSKAAEKTGLFTLTVPTGGGKTLASMAFALHHAIANNLKRIIYVIPYTSIIEQNASVFKSAVGAENVLEHHSNFDWNGKSLLAEPESADDETNEALNKLKLAAENWDIPIIVTTNVQFFESLYANRSSRCRKLHNLAKSVIIFDETQMLPMEYLRPCMYAVNELVKNYGATAVFCTATQPPLEQFFPKPVSPKELAPDPQSLFNFYKRVQVSFVGKLTDDELTERLHRSPKALCIVNTRKHARGLFKGLVEEGRFHLSTLMCPAHRKKTISEIQQRLADGQPCRVVSTQIMEAGINIDFPLGYRSLSGLDSIIQAAGRVNREGRSALGVLYVFDPDSPFVKRTPAYIRQGAEVARAILSKYPDPVCVEAVRSYYQQLYDLHDTQQAFDAKGILNCFEKGALGEFDFKTAAEAFRIIENDTAAVVIPYCEEAINLLNDLRGRPYPPSDMLRKLQVYTVNIYRQEFAALESKGAIELLSGSVASLINMDYYDLQTGLIIPEIGGDAIFFDG